MENILEPIPAEVKESLKRQGFKPYTHEPISNWINPHRSECLS